MTEREIEKVYTIQWSVVIMVCGGVRIGSCPGDGCFLFPDMWLGGRDGGSGGANRVGWLRGQKESGPGLGASS